MSNHNSSRPTKAQIRKALKALNAVKAEQEAAGRKGWVTEDDAIIRRASQRYGVK